MPTTARRVPRAGPRGSRAAARPGPGPAALPAAAARPAGPRPPRGQPCGDPLLRSQPVEPGPLRRPERRQQRPQPPRVGEHGEDRGPRRPLAWRTAAAGGPARPRRRHPRPGAGRLDQLVVPDAGRAGGHAGHAAQAAVEVPAAAAVPAARRPGAASSGGSGRAASPSPRPRADRSGRRAGRTRSARSRRPARAARRSGRARARLGFRIRSLRRTGRAPCRWPGSNWSLTARISGRDGTGPQHVDRGAATAGAARAPRDARTGAAPSPAARPGGAAARHERGHRVAVGGRRAAPACSTPAPADPPTAGLQPAAAAASSQRRARRPAPPAQNAIRSAVPPAPAGLRAPPAGGSRATSARRCRAGRASGRPLGHLGRVAFEQHRHRTGAPRRGRSISAADGASGESSPRARRLPRPARTAHAAVT